METKALTYKGIVEDILSHVTYKDWKFEVTCVHETDGVVPKLDGDLFLRVAFVAPDNVTGKPELQLGRKWLIEYGTPATGVVQAAWLAVQRAEMHEIAEQFAYKGATLFNRHIDVEALVDASKQVQ